MIYCSQGTVFGLESLCIKTFALERPTSSLYYLINGVICDVYFIQGVVAGIW